MFLMKKYSSILFVLFTILALSTVAFAAGSGSITVENATIGEDYAGYRIFDATYADGAVSYTIKTTDPWYSLVSASSSPFTLTQVGATNTYNVSRKSAASDSDIIAWLKAQTLPSTPSLANITATTTNVSWSNVPYGYYLITSSLDSLVTVTNVNKNVTIIDKNQNPGWEDPDPEDPNTEQGKNVSSDGTTYGKTNTSSIGDTVYFKINAFVPKYNKDMQVYQYIFTDTLDPGLTYNANSLSLKIGNTTMVSPGDYTVSVNGQVITVTLKVYDITNYPTDAKMEINFTAMVNEDAVYDNKNTVSMTWKEFDPTEDPGENPGDPNYPTDPGTGDTPPDSKTDTYVYGFNLQKYAGSISEANKLTGAEFKLYDALTGGNEIPVVWDATLGGYRVALSTETGVAIPAGTAKIFGLAAGTYYLEETKAPDGYNPLTARQAVEISAGNSTSGYLTNEVAVINLTGTVLPETGGIGTTIFYVVGSLLMGGAVILMVTRKRMSAGRN